VPGDVAVLTVITSSMARRGAVFTLRATEAGSLSLLVASLHQPALSLEGRGGGRSCAIINLRVPFF
jgi:hypothetical protein